MNYKNIFYFIFISQILFSCKNDPLDVEPSEKKLNISFINLDSIFVNTPKESLKQVISSLKVKNEEILDYELGHCLRVGQLSDSGTVERINMFVNDTYIKRLEKRIESEFTNLESRKAKIIEAFAYLNHHFPTGKIPQNVIFMNSLFTSNIFCTEHEVGIGLERYLGPKTDVIKELPNEQFFQWIKDGMLDIYLERDVLTAWIMTHYVPEKKSNTAEAIVNWGKIIYFTEAAFPNEEERIVLRYSKKDYDWALENEYAFWKYLVDEKLLFGENERDQANFLNDAPFTIGLPEKGPDRLGQFLGWRMIHSYMEQHPETTLEELKEIPYNTILQEYEI
ncbi:MAG: hypothetical protein V4622_07105 [Bacteroidota bacterium]